MTIEQFLLVSSLPLFALLASIVRGETNIDAHLRPTGCLANDCDECICGDAKYRSECFGPNGCRCAGLCNRKGCGKVCRSTMEEATEERSCWKVGCEEVCIPRVVCPWSEGGSGLTIFNRFKRKSSSACDACCDSCSGAGSSGSDCCGTPRCGDVRCVRVLDSEDYEVTTCKCKWDIDKCSTYYGPGCGPRNRCGCVGDGESGCGDPCAIQNAASSNFKRQALTASTPSRPQREAIAMAFSNAGGSNEDVTPLLPASTEADVGKPTNKERWKWWRESALGLHPGS